MALLSRLPIETGAVRDFSGLLWADLPGATLPRRNGALFPGDAVYEVQRLASVAQWDVPVKAGATVLHLLAFHAAPPVFDGPEDRNGLRNADELRLWQLYLGGRVPGFAPPEGPAVIVGDANNDPAKGDGRHEAIVALITDPRLQDPQPQSAIGGNDTVDWPAPGPGRLRVDYVLPSAGLRVLASGVFWPETGPMAEQAASASRHRLVWVDVDLPD